LGEADRLLALAQVANHGEGQLRHDVATAFATLRGQMVRREVATIPVARLRDTARDGRLRLGPLEAAGYKTVLSILDTTEHRLLAVPGVGEGTARHVMAAARQVAAAVEDNIKVRIDLDPTDAASTAVITRLYCLGEFERQAAGIRNPAARLDAELAPLLVPAARAGSRLRMFFTGPRRRAEATAALARLEEVLDATHRSGLTADLEHVADLLHGGGPEPAVAWKDFEQRAVEYYGRLGEIVDLGLDVHAAEGFLPAEIVERIRQQQLDDRFRQVSLRGYQSFGARFALVQRRVIIGDEMGLGKTIEAIAAIAHLKALGKTHFLVVCPASVLINWTREIAAQSRLRAHRLHGLDRAANLKTWLRTGDIAVTTFDSLRSLAVADEVDVAMLVVDEAHYVKNRAAQRSRIMVGWTERVERVLFLTGTPMENRVGEFESLVSYLRPQLLAGIHSSSAVAGATAFRRAVAPVYLRRNQEDVLTELPALVRTDEWVEFGRQDFAAYRDAVRAGNFMAMRRAAYAPGDPGDSAKLQRLLELVSETAANGRKVVVFSYFRDVLDTVHQAIGRSFGPITGDVTPARRQAIVDDFSRASGRAVLISQIQAGGVGLNMQAASTVIICEPQIKPTMEDQAVARAHRMGQVRSVQVHRMLVADSVDQRMLELLGAKARLFDDYARRSDMAQATPEAVDISEVELARRVVEMEQERLALQAVSSHQIDDSAN
jgi:superfamily II DNA or RNA helicase